MTQHRPEVILNNFTTRLGHSVGRMFASWFPQVPQFTGRRVVTFHNQRDFVFLRHHRYTYILSIEDGALLFVGGGAEIVTNNWRAGAFRIAIRFCE